MASCLFFFFFFSFFPFSVLHFLPLSVYLTPLSTELDLTFYFQNAFITALCPQTFCFFFPFPSSTLPPNLYYSFHCISICHCPCPSLDTVPLATLFCSPFAIPCPSWWSFITSQMRIWDEATAEHTLRDCRHSRWSRYQSIAEKCLRKVSTPQVGLAKAISIIH